MIKPVNYDKLLVQELLNLYKKLSNRYYFIRRQDIHKMHSYEEIEKRMDDLIELQITLKRLHSLILYINGGCEGILWFYASAEPNENWNPEEIKDIEERL